MIVRSFFPSLFWMGVIFFLSIIPGSNLPDFSFWRIFSMDKLIHAIFFSILSFQLMNGCMRQYNHTFIRKNSVIIALTIAIIYGGIVELYQEMYLIDRYGDWLDILANIVGAMAGVVVFRIIYFKYIR
jgi:VanZ family protein